MTMKAGTEAMPAELYGTQVGTLCLKPDGPTYESDPSHTRVSAVEEDGVLW